MGKFIVFIVKFAHLTFSGDWGVFGEWEERRSWLQGDLQAFGSKHVFTIWHVLLFGVVFRVDTFDLIVCINFIVFIEFSVVWSCVRVVCIAACVWSLLLLWKSTFRKRTTDSWHVRVLWVGFSDLLVYCGSCFWIYLCLSYVCVSVFRICLWFYRAPAFCDFMIFVSTWIALPIEAKLTYLIVSSRRLFWLVVVAFYFPLLRLAILNGGEHWLSMFLRFSSFMCPLCKFD